MYIFVKSLKMKASFFCIHDYLKYVKELLNISNKTVLKFQQKVLRKVVRYII